MSFLLREIEDETFLNQNFSLAGDIADAYYRCTFEACNFQDLDLDKVLFEDCTFKNCNLSLVKLLGGKMSFCRFEDSKILAVNWSQLEHARELSFARCILDGSIFHSMNLPYIKFSESSLKDVDLSAAQLKESDFSSCDLKGAIFEGCDLRKADFRNARSYAISPVDNRLSKAKFSNPEVLSLLSFFDIEIY
ncbi:MAG: pentapeptide repeat-containing protein [Oligoflexus sp.]